MSIDFNGPKDKRQLGAVLAVPNLLLTTLAIVAPSLLPLQAGRISDSAPQSRSDQFGYAQVAVIGTGATPAIAQQSTSAPILKYQVIAEQPPRPLTLGFAAPAVPSLTTVRWDWSAPPPKAAVYSDPVVTHPLTLGIAPPPKIGQWSDSAPVTKFAVVAENKSSQLTLGIASSPPNILQQYDSAPAIKYQVQVDAYQNVLVQGIKNPPSPRQLSDSAPITKYQVVAQNQGSQLTIGYVLPAPPVALPLGLPVDQFQYQGKFATQVDAYPNVLVLGYPVPPPVIVTTDTHDGLPKRHKRKHDDTAQTQVIRESRLKPKKAKAPATVEAPKPLFVNVVADTLEDEEALMALIQRQDDEMLEQIELATHLLRTLH